MMSRPWAWSARARADTSKAVSVPMLLSRWAIRIVPPPRTVRGAPFGWPSRRSAQSSAASRGRGSPRPSVAAPLATSAPWGRVREESPRCDVGSPPRREDGDADRARIGPMTRFFDLDEANATIPEVRQILESLRDQRTELIRLRDEVLARGADEARSDAPAE